MSSAGLYVRVSSSSQAEKGYSIGEQTERLRKYAEAMGWTIYRVYTDAGYTGANMNRPALNELIRDVKAGRIDKVLVYKLDRLSRSQKDTLALIEDGFLSHGADFVSMSENFDTSTPFGKATVGILAVFAQLEREQIAERMAMGREARVKSGKYRPHRNTVPGYRYIDGELRVYEPEAVMIRRLFELGRQHVSPERIARQLNDEGMIPSVGPWNDRTVRSRIRSRIYIGEVNYSKKWYPGLHEPIVDRETWGEVNTWLADRTEAHRYKGQRDGKVVSYLGGLLYCARCGAKYTFRHSVIRKPGREEPYDYKVYFCNSRRNMPRLKPKDPNCKNKTWKADELEAIVFGEIKKLALDPDWIAGNDKPKDDRRLASVEKGIKKAETELSRLIDLYAVGGMPVEALQKRIAETQARKDRLVEEAERLQQEKKKKVDPERVRREALSFADVLEGGDLHDVRAVVTDLIERIEIDGDDLTFYWRF